MLARDWTETYECVISAANALDKTLPGYAGMSMAQTDCLTLLMTLSSFSGSRILLCITNGPFTITHGM